MEQIWKILSTDWGTWLDLSASGLHMHKESMQGLCLRVQTSVWVGGPQID